MSDGDALASNRTNWDQRADIHARSQMYDVEGFLADPEQISDVVERDLTVLTPHLPDTGVRGRSLLHLQCHIGTDTVSCHTTNYEWRHDLGEIVGALLGAGVRIEALAELPYMDWPAFPALVSGPQGWAFPPGTPRIPLNFAIVARRPA